MYLFYVIGTSCQKWIPHLLTSRVEVCNKIAKVIDIMSYKRQCLFSSTRFHFQTCFGARDFQ